MKALKILLVFTFLFLIITETSSDSTWTDLGQLGDANMVLSLILYDGKLYAGTTDTEDVDGDYIIHGHVYRYDGATWTDVGELEEDWGVLSLTVYNGNLYAGTRCSYFDAECVASVYRYGGGSTWTKIGELGDEWGVSSLAFYNGKLYASTFVKEWIPTGGSVYRYEGGTTWTDVGPLGDAQNVYSLTIYDNKLYAGTYSWNNGGHVYRYDGGTVWTDVGRLGNSWRVRSLAVYDGKLYGGAGISVYRYDGGTTWTNVGLVGLISSFAVYDDKLYVGTTVGDSVYRYDGGTTWKNVGLDVPVESLAVYDGKLYAGTFEPWPEGGHVYRYDVKTGCDALIENKKQDLAERFSPYFYLFDYPTDKFDEIFRPIEIEEMLNNSSLYELTILAGNVELRNLIDSNPTSDEIKNFINSGTTNYYLDLKRDETGNLTEEIVNLQDLDSKKVYAHVTCDDYGGKWVVIQYWFHYFYNYFPFDDHEGDWEMIEVLIDYNEYLENEINAIPKWAFYSRHTGGEGISWSNIEKHPTDVTHPILYVARGSHAAYFKPGKYVLYGVSWLINTFDYARGNGNPIKPSVQVIENEPWLGFGGNWGYTWGTSRPIWFDGPIGPKYQKNKWKNPAEWGFTVINPSIWIGQPIITISIGSPDETLITNQNGERIGYVNGEFIQEIPNSYVNSLGEEEIYLIPANDVYTVQIFGTGDGKFSFIYELETPDQSRILAYTDILVTPITLATTTVGASITDYTLNIDSNGDGIVDKAVNPDIGVSLTSHDLRKLLKKEMTTKYIITIKNEGKNQDIFDLTVTLPEDWMYEFSQDIVSLKAGESIDVTLFITPKSDVKGYERIIVSSQINQGLSVFLRLSQQGQWRKTVDTTKPIKPLANNRIDKAMELKERAEELLKMAKEKGIDAKECEEIYGKAIEYLEKARKFYRGKNYIAANKFVLKAIDLFEEVIECLEGF